MRVKKELTCLLNKEAFGYLVRSRHNNNASVEVASLYQANQEMKNSVKNSLSKLEIEGKVEDDCSLVEN